MARQTSILKYSLDISSGEHNFKIEMPVGAHIVDVASQFQEVCIWALVEAEEPYGFYAGDRRPPMETREFETAMTGDVLVDEDRIYLGTAHFLIGRSPFVVHVFEKAELN